MLLHLQIFHVLRGELRFKLGDAVLTGRGKEGDMVVLPKGIPHTYQAVTDTATFTTILRGGDFEGYCRAVSRPAEGIDLPPASQWSQAQMDGFRTAAHDHGIDWVGPPGVEEEEAQT